VHDAVVNNAVVESNVAVDSAVVSNVAVDNAVEGHDLHDLHSATDLLHLLMWIIEKMRIVQLPL
jgi:hypothetical protein